MLAALTLSGLHKSFGAKQAVSGLDLQVPAGSLFGLVGPNGAGKTTTLSMATGLLRPDAGTAVVLGRDVWSDPAAAKALIGVLPDGLRLFDRLTGGELLRYVGLLRRVPLPDILSRSAELLGALGLTEDRDTLVVEYSAGMTKKVGLACALIHAPRLLVLDEPFEAVDPVSGEGIRAILRNYTAGGGTVVLSSHVMELVESLCDACAVVAQGRVLVAGSLAGRGPRVVAHLVRLKLTLLRNSLRRSAWRAVGLVLGMIYALALVVLALAGLVGLRHASPALTADVTVLAYSLLTLGWLVLSLLVFGVDETVDPRRFALLPLRARELLPGLLVAGLVGSPGVATVLVAAGLVVTWARSLPLTVAALVAFPLGVATCFLFSRAATAAFASALSSRRFRDFAFLLLALTGAGLGLGGNLLSGVLGRGGLRYRESLATVAEILGWTPFGWAWSVPADLARQRWSVAGLHLLLAVGLVVALWRVWGHFLVRRLVEPADAGGPAVRMRRGRLLERLYPPSPAGAVAERTLHYWRRDPRYLAGVAGLLVGPMILVVTQLVNPGGSTAVAAFAPVLAALLMGMSMAQDLSYDGTALWLHVSTGISGAEDRWGRVLSTLTVFGPMLLVLLVVTLAVTRRWELLPAVLALTLALALAGLAAGCVLGALWQWPASPPGASPFQRGSSGGLAPLLSMLATGALSVVLALPTIALVVASAWHPWTVYPALALAVLLGALFLRLGVRTGGRLLDRRWPEVMLAVSERSA